MSDETRRVLELVAQGKVTVEEADRLLHAIGRPSAEDSVEPIDRAKPRFVRIAIHKPAQEGQQDKDVNIRVPMALVKSGIKLGTLIQGLADDKITTRLRERGLDVDFSKLDAATIETMFTELGETSIDIDAGKAQVRITAE